MNSKSINIFKYYIFIFIDNIYKEKYQIKKNIKLKLILIDDLLNNYNIKIIVFNFKFSYI